MKKAIKVLKSNRKTNDIHLAEMRLKNGPEKIEAGKKLGYSGFYEAITDMYFEKKYSLPKVTKIINDTAGRNIVATGTIYTSISTYSPGQIKEYSEQGRGPRQGYKFSNIIKTKDYYEMESKLDNIDEKRLIAKKMGYELFIDIIVDLSVNKIKPVKEITLILNKHTDNEIKKSTVIGYMNRLRAIYILPKNITGCSIEYQEYICSCGNKIINRCLSPTKCLQCINRDNLKLYESECAGKKNMFL